MFTINFSKIVLLNNLDNYNLESTLNKGLITKTTGSWHTVSDGNKKIKCQIKGKFRIKDIKTTNPVAVGDMVTYEIPENSDTGIITKIHERKNYIIRRATRFHKEAHLLACNVDQALLIITLKNPVTKAEFIDRFLISCEAYHIPVILIINKIDLLDNEKETLNDFIYNYELAGYKCIQTSVKNNFNIDIVKSLIKNKLSLIAGNSGVGKSSILNAMNTSLNINVGNLSDYYKTGKHTTTYYELYEIEPKSYIIDSPGIKAYGIIDIEKNELGLLFPEIFRYSDECKYYNCTHIHEPDCGVIKAVEQGKISLSRYENYVNIYLEEGSKYRN